MVQTHVGIAMLDRIPMQQAPADRVQRRLDEIAGLEINAAREITERPALGKDLASLKLLQIRRRKETFGTQLFQRTSLDSRGTGNGERHQNEVFA